MLYPAAYLATSSQGGGGGDTPLYSNLKLIAVPVLATILHTAPLTTRTATSASRILLLLLLYITVANLSNIRV